jgi:hypothetical protein
MIPSAEIYADITQFLESHMERIVRQDRLIGRSKTLGTLVGESEGMVEFYVDQTSVL